MRWLVMVVIAGAAALGVKELGDRTQTRPEVVDPASRAEVTFSVRTHGYLGPTDDAARTLWEVCRPQLGWRTQVVEAPQVEAGQLSVVVNPAPGRHATLRLRGCIEDATLDRVNGRLVAITPVGT